MKILVFSDSHGTIRSMRQYVQALNPDAMVHLGDHYSDGEELAAAFPEIPLFQVPGNCDEGSFPPFAQEICIQRICGVEFYLTHGHIHRAKQSLSMLLRDARAAKVQAALYGHTHIPDCHQEYDGLWVLNPGKCGYFRGTAGLIEVDNHKIVSCRVLQQEDLEGLK